MKQNLLVQMMDYKDRRIFAYSFALAAAQHTTNKLRLKGILEIISLENKFLNLEYHFRQNHSLSLRYS